MVDTSDIELLRRYSQQGADDSFAELVRRHIPLVYSTALRHVGVAAHAEEITQAVFIVLAQKAGQLREGVVLEGWLYQTTRHTALNFLRGERRRQMREQEAYMQSQVQESDNPPVWNQLAPLLDEAMGRLGEKDRQAILLRYFKGKHLAEIAMMMSTTEAAAQSRVLRAVEKMRKFFARRGVTLSSTAIAGTISANSIQAAPAGLAAIISANVVSGTTITTAAVIAATKAIAMTTFQKAIVTAALVTTVGAGVYEARQNYESREQIQNLQQQQNPLNDQLARLQRERDEAARRLDGLIAENAQLKSSSSELELLKLRGQVGAASQAAADATAKMQSLSTSSGVSQLEAMRNETRAHLNTFFKLANLPPDKADQYVNLEVDMQQRQDARLKALLAGTLSVADAVRQRDQDNQEQQDQRSELLGPDGSAVLQSIADGMRNNVAKGLITTIQANMGDNPLTQQQSDQLQGAIKAEVAANTMDDTDLFRPVDEWTQMVTDHEQNVLQAASGFLTPAQLGTLQSLEAANLKLLLQKRDLRRKALGITQ
ncbi:MAG TPA: sigma-70 family RNA polymerase sigma factor [Candidatus Sulfotelmatobacter sp.]|jgi:RNA polymerase sigma factor (sigma-70 family)|nr:sigma-70 family RNA polymerase sigma factor [Candidatus Sulfotelmatobacter sp.]